MVPKTFTFVLIAIALAAFAALAANRYMRDSSALRTEATLAIGSASVSVEIADTLALQVRGLSGRGSLAADRGMLFAYSNAKVRSFWTKGMRFPLDVVWIADQVVIGMQENVPYESDDGEVVRFKSNKPADMALEVNAGWIAEHGVRIGDSVMIAPPIR